MTILQNSISTYKVDLRSGRYSNNFPAYIYGYDSSDNHVMTCVFFDNEEVELPENKKVDGVVHLYFNMSRFSIVLDLFRNEGPLHFIFDTDGKECAIQTDKEPVGEGEMNGNYSG